MFLKPRKGIYNFLIKKQNFMLYQSFLRHLFQLIVSTIILNFNLTSL